MDATWIAWRWTMTRVAAAKRRPITDEVAMLYYTCADCRRVVEEEVVKMTMMMIARLLMIDLEE
jgi:hypothetical protein